MTWLKPFRLLFLSLCSLMVLTVQPSVGGDKQTIILVQDAAYPPFMIADPDGPAGIYAEIVRAAAERLPDYDIDLQSAPWTRAKYMVETGQAHGLVGTYHKPVRRPWIRHFSTPMANETIFVYCREGIGDKNWDYPKDYAVLLFTNNAGFATPGTEFFEMVENGEILLLEEQTTDENLRLLHLGRADCYVQEKIAVEIAIGFNGFKKIRPVRKVLMEPAHIGYSKEWSAQDGDAFIKDMDTVLKEMTDDGTIKNIIRKWAESGI